MMSDVGLELAVVQDPAVGLLPAAVLLWPAETLPAAAAAALKPVAAPETAADSLPSVQVHPEPAAVPDDALEPAAVPAAVAVLTFAADSAAEDAPMTDIDSRGEAGWWSPERHGWLMLWTLAVWAAAIAEPVQQLGNVEGVGVPAVPAAAPAQHAEPAAVRKCFAPDADAQQ